MQIRILLADDHAMVRQGLRSLLEKEPGFVIVAEAADGREAVRLACESRPDVVVLDLSMPFLNGVDAARQILERGVPTRIILVTQHVESPYVLDALRAGVKGYVVKTKAATILIGAIWEVSGGGTYLSPEISQTVVHAFLNPESSVPASPLSSREREVLRLLAEGNSTKEIAHVLGQSVKTVESHRTRMMQKLNIHETASLVRYAIRTGLVQP
jgi:two-component system response regulator NreC